MALLAAGQINSVTIESAVLEVATLLKMAEDLYVPQEGETKKSCVNIGVTGDGYVSIQAKLKLSSGIGLNGEMVQSVVPYC